MLPPYELIGIGAIVQQYGDPVELFDAIAKGASEINTFHKIGQYSPSLIVTITGFESFEEDMLFIKQIKTIYPHITIAVIGHFPTIFYDEVLSTGYIDYVILGEPDERFRTFYEEFRNGKQKVRVSGVVARYNGNITYDNNADRIQNISELPIPAHDLLPKNAYYEPLLPKPMGMIQSARGCPYVCSYCVKSFGTALSVKTPEKVIEEIKFLIRTQNIKYLRFIDDTFTVSAKRVIDICKLIISEGIKIKWSCLSRTDNIKPEMLRWMRESGCQRIYFGIESGSQKILDLYKKKINVNESFDALARTQEANIETTGFFMMGFPEETWTETLETINFATTAALTYAGVEPLVPYPGTPLFEEIKDKVNFSLMPYQCSWKDKKIMERYMKAEKMFYKKFYLRSNYVLQNIKNYALNPQSAAPILGRFVSYLTISKNNIMNGIHYKR